MWRQLRFLCHCRHSSSPLWQGLTTEQRTVFRQSVSPPRHLLKSLDQPLALQAGQSLKPEQSVQLIDLMLVANGAQTRRFLALRVAGDVVIADPDSRMTPDVRIDPGHRDDA